MGAPGSGLIFVLPYDKKFRDCALNAQTAKTDFTQLFVYDIIIVLAKAKL